MNESKPLETNARNLNRFQSEKDTNYSKPHQELTKHYEESMTLMAQIVITENMEIQEIKTNEMLLKKLISLDVIDCNGFNDI